jgi:hypothetical protein
MSQILCKCGHADHDHYRDGDRRCALCSCQSWRPTRLTMDRVRQIKAIGFDRPFGRDSFQSWELEALCDMILSTEA